MMPTHADLMGEISVKLKSYQQKKMEHRTSSQCDAHMGAGCTGCHFWSGSIAALSDLLGEPGVKD